MFYFLSKTLDVFLMPLAWVIVFFSLAIFFRKKRKQLLIIGTLLLYLCSNSFLINEILLWWEHPPTPLEEIKEQYEVGIVLSGFTKHTKSPHDRVHLTQGADRAMHAVMLYRKGILKNILVTGRYVTISGDTANAASQIRDLLLSCGIPDSAIWTESKAKNTYENAVFTAELLEKKFPIGKKMLITSAFHMRRASACFKKVNVEFIPFATDFYSSDRKIGFPGVLAFSADSLRALHKIVREVAGYLVYGVMGYL